MARIGVPFRDATVIVDPAPSGAVNPETGRPSTAGERPERTVYGYFRQSAENLRGQEQSTSDGVSETVDAQVIYPAGTVVHRLALIVVPGGRYSIIGQPRPEQDRLGVESHLVVNLRLLRDLQGA